MALKDITLGQYFPGNTLLRRLDPRTKLLFAVAYIVTLFLAKQVVSYAILFVLLAMLIAVPKVDIRSILRSTKPILIIAIITGLLNLFYTRGKGAPLVSFRVFTIYPEGIWAAVFMALRITMLITCTFLLTYTTSPILLTDGLGKLIGPPKTLHVPAHELSIMTSIVSRFVPTLIEEADKVMSAQKARGADLDTDNLLQKAKALVPLLIPLFISAFRRTDGLAITMEYRCYHGEGGRTHLRQLRLKGIDIIALVFAVLLCVDIGVLRHFGLQERNDRILKLYKKYCTTLDVCGDDPSQLTPQHKANMPAARL